jgi:hypothetical protein
VYIQIQLLTKEKAWSSLLLGSSSTKTRRPSLASLFSRSNCTETRSRSPSCPCSISNTAKRGNGIERDAVIFDGQHVLINRLSSDRDSLRELRGDLELRAHGLVDLGNLIFICVEEFGGQRVLILRWVWLLVLCDVDTALSWCIAVGRWDVGFNLPPLLVRVVLYLATLELLPALGHTASVLPGTAVFGSVVTGGVSALEVKVRSQCMSHMHFVHGTVLRGMDLGHSSWG